MSSEQQNLESRDYDVSAITNYDSRFEAGRKDSVILHMLGFVFTVAATVWMYAFGTGEPTQMRYFLGFPVWISGATVIYLVMFVIGMVYVSKWEEFPLEARNSKKGGGE